VYRGVAKGQPDEVPLEMLMTILGGGESSRLYRDIVKEQKLAEVADGRVFTAQQALQEGLIDKIGYLPDGIEWAKEMAGVRKAQVVIYHRPLGYAANAYGVATSSASGVGPLINVELPEWLNSGGAQFLYLWEPGDK